MREDGFELDKIILARDSNYVPQGVGPRPSNLLTTACPE